MAGKLLHSFVMIVLASRDLFQTGRLVTMRRQDKSKSRFAYKKTAETWPK